MLKIILENWSTILVCAILIGIISLIIVKLIRDKRRGKTLGCDCGCNECHYSKNCQTKYK